jgi:allantoicase
MDGWETRRRRTPGHDWCIVRLGLPGIVHALVVDTAFFTGNYPSHCSVEACGLPPGADATADSVVWRPLLGRSELAGNTANTFMLQPSPHGARRFTHVRLNIFPDGGVARLRVYGDAVPAWTRTLAADDEPEVDLAAVANGGYVVDTSDRFYGEPRNMLMPYPAANMGDGWETKRRRGPGHDWAVVRLAVPGAIRRIEIDTTHFKGNYPAAASVEGAVVPDDAHGVSADSATRAIADWKTALAETALQPDHRHRFDVQPLVASHVRLNIFPDGGISRFRVVGTPTAESRRAAVIRQLNAMDDPDLRDALSDFCAAPAWIEAMAAARPYPSAAGLLQAADAAWAHVDDAGWREAFRHHPRIGERRAERPQSATAAQASAREQAGVDAAGEVERDALARANRDYEERFGHVFIIAAAGKGPREILEALRSRIAHDPATELRVAGGEQQQITRRRLRRLLALDEVEP